VRGLTFLRAASHAQSSPALLLRSISVRRSWSNSVGHPELPQLPPRTWIATVVHANGKRTDVPVAIRDSEGERPFPGVKWIFPPTLTNPKETVVG